MFSLAVFQFAVLPVFGVLVAAPAGQDETCPSARQVTDAMQARFPIALVMPDQQLPARADILRAALDVSPDGTAVRFALIDVRGEIQLRRTLSTPGRGQGVADCLALADTLAAIVERYLVTINYEASESPMQIGRAASTPVASGPAMPPSELATRPRAGLALVGVSWRMPGAAPGGQGEIQGRIEGSVEITRAIPRLAALVSVGASMPREAPLSDGRTGTLLRFPMRVGALLELPAGPGWVEPSIELGADLLLISSTASSVGGPASRMTRFGPGVDAAIGYRLRVAGPIHIRPRAAIGFSFTRYDVGVDGAGAASVFTTPWASASFGIDTGVLFQ